MTKNQYRFLKWVQRYYPEVWQEFGPDKGLGFDWGTAVSSIITAAGSAYAAREQNKGAIKLKQLELNAIAAQNNQPVNTSPPGPGWQSPASGIPKEYFIYGGLAVAAVVLIALLKPSARTQGTSEVSK